MLRVECRLENADLPTDTKHPLIPPSIHILTRLIILDEHAKAGHASPCYTLMRTRQRFWIAYGISSVKRYLTEWVTCAMRKATPIRQLMADLPTCRVTVTNKPIKYCSVDYLGLYIYRQNLSNCTCRGLYSCTHCIHVEIVTNLDLNDFCSRFLGLQIFGELLTLFIRILARRFELLLIGFPRCLVRQPFCTFYRTSLRYLFFTFLTLTQKRVALGFLVNSYMRKRSYIWIGYFEFDFAAVQWFRG